MNTTCAQIVLGTDPSAMDDFKLIRGIGLSVEDRLHKAGVLTYCQLAEMQPREIARILKGLVGFTPERIASQDWNGQARKYASEKRALEPEVDSSISGNQQHYAVFTLELLLDKENNVRRTKVMHVQSQQEKTWAGWDGERLLDFIGNEAALSISAEMAAVTSFQMQPNAESAHMSHPAIHPESPTEPLELSGKLHLLNLESRPSAQESSRHFIRGDQPFGLDLTLDMSDVKCSADTPIRYLAVIYAKELGSYQRQDVGSSDGIILPANNVSIHVKSPGLACGMYWMDAVVILSPPHQKPKPGSGPMAIIEGGLFQVY